MQVIAGSSPRRRRRNSRRLPYIIVRNNGISITDARYGGSVTRATIALQFNHATSSYIQVATGVDRAQHDVYGNDGQWHLNYRLAGEPQRTNSALGSCDPTGGSGYWTNAGTLGIAAASASCIPGQTAYVITNVSSTTAALTQVIGTFGTAGTVRADGIIVEQGTGTKTMLQVYDVTAGALLGTVTLTWAGLVLATTGTVTAKAANVHGTGPNGGVMVKLWLTTTSVAASGSTPGGAGNSFRLDFIPSGGVSDTATTIWHHIQDELGLFPSTPIVTGVGSGSRNAEIQGVPLPVAAQSAQALCVYEKYVDQGAAIYAASGAGNYRWALGFGGAPYWKGDINGLGNTRHAYTNGTDAAIGTTAGGATSLGQTVETRDILFADASRQAGDATNGGAESLGSVSTAYAHGIITPWYSNVLYIGSGGIATGGLALGTFILAAGTPSMNQFRGM